MDKEKIVNRRRTERLPTHYDVIYSDGKRMHKEYVRDISVGGMQIEALKPLEPGTKLTLTLTSVPPLKVKAIVRWVKKVGYRYRIGVQFIQLSNEQQQKIKEIIHSLFWETHGSPYR